MRMRLQGMLEKDTVQRYDLEDYIMTMRSKFGVIPTVVGREMEDIWKPETSSWIKPRKPLDDNMRRKLFAVMVSEEIRHVMKHHLLRFSEKLYKQSEGDSIGSILAGVVAKARTILFMRKLRKLCEKLGLVLYLLKIYVDDVLVLMRSPGNGLVVKGDHLKQDQEQKIKDEKEEIDG